MATILKDKAVAHAPTATTGKDTIPTKVISDKSRDKVARALQPILYDLIAFGLIVKQAHWNVTGPHFRAIHLHLDEIRDVVDGAVDTVAERIVAVGVTASGQANEVLENTTVRQIPLGFQKDMMTIDLISDRLGDLIRTTREHMETIEDVDVVTADILHGIVEDIEKHHWMLKVQQE